MKSKKILKRLKKNLYAVFLTLVVIGYAGFEIIKSIYNEKVYLAEKEIELRVKRVHLLDSLRTEKISLANQIDVLDALQEKYLSGISDNSMKSKKLSERIMLADEKIILSKLLESLRKDFSTIEPGIQIIDDKEYMEKYRENEATYILAVSLSKKLNVHDQYKEFFKNREGMWNIMTHKN